MSDGAPCAAVVARLLQPLLSAALARVCPAAPASATGRELRLARSCVAGGADLRWDAPRACFLHAEATGAGPPRFHHASALAAAALAEAASDALHALVAHAAVSQDTDGVVLLTSRESAAAASMRCVACGRAFAGRRSLRDHAQSAHGAGYGLAVSAVASAAAAALRARTVAARPPQPPQPLPAPLAAARDGDLAALEALAAGGWEASSCRDRHGATPLLWAAGGGHLDACRLLVARCGAQPRSEVAVNGRTAVHWAARHGHAVVVAWLVTDCGCDGAAATRDGTTPLHLAAWQGHVPVCAFLAAATPAAVAAPNAYGCAAAHWAALRDANAADGMCAWLSSAGADWHARNAAGHAPLHKAAVRGAASLVDWLLSHADCDALIDALDADGNTPLALAAIWGEADAARVLLRHGANPDAFAPPAGAAPLAWATLMGHDAVARVLREAGADEDAARACTLQPGGQRD